ncbi:MAG: metalloprotease [Marmoricola sp.]|nr:metalloprotease [Marmoricola sp.]
MSRELDVRQPIPIPMLTTRLGALRERASAISALMPGEQQISVDRIDPLTLNPSRITAQSSQRTTGDYTDRALEFLSTISGVLGLDGSQAPEFLPASAAEQRTSSGAVSVRTKQVHGGIDIFGAGQTVIFDPGGALRGTSGLTASVPSDSRAEPVLGVQDAVRSAASHIAAPQPDEAGAVDGLGESLEHPPVDLAGFEPVVQEPRAEMVDRAATVTAAPFVGPVPVRLLWLPVADGLRLTWEVVMALPGGTGRYRVLVSTEDGSILYCKQLLQFAAAAGNVFLQDGSTPRQLVHFPRAMSDFPIQPTAVPDAFPRDWVHEDSSSGNSVTARRPGVGVLAATGLLDGVPAFDPAEPEGSEQHVLNLFYFSCYMHDFLYLLGFTESDGNFQADNFDLGGAAGDAVDAVAHPTPVWATANMFTPADGSGPSLNMGPLASTQRHTALDASIAFHEYTHGLSNRLVGGPSDSASLEAAQSAGLSEGWSDYVACFLTGREVIGAWVSGKVEGVRGFPYTTEFPATYADVGRGRYVEPHAIGEIWCALLMELGRTLDRSLVLQLVVDSLKLASANPSFTVMRDCMLAALDHRMTVGASEPVAHESAVRATWKVFARYGLGPGASSLGSTLFGVVPDFTSPFPLDQQFRPWQVLMVDPVPPATRLAAAVAPTGELCLVTAGLDGRVSTSTSTSSGTWEGWRPLPLSPLAGGLTVGVAARPSGELAVVTAGFDGRVYLAASTSSGTWEDWRPLPLPPLARGVTVGAAARPSGELAVVTAGFDGRVYLATSTASGTWEGWHALPTQPLTRGLTVAVVTRPSGDLALVTAGFDGRVYLVAAVDV